MQGAHGFLPQSQALQHISEVPAWHGGAEDTCCVGNVNIGPWFSKAIELEITSHISSRIEFVFFTPRVNYCVTNEFSLIAPSSHVSFYNVFCTQWMDPELNIRFY